MVRGHTVIEAVFAMAVLTIVAGVVFIGEGAQLRGVKASFDELKASRVAAGRLEELRGLELVEGERPFAGGAESVRRLAPGLFEVAVVVDGFRLVTVVAREEPR